MTVETVLDELLSGVRAQLAIKLFGRDLDVLAEKGKEIENLTARVEGTTDVAMEQTDDAVNNTHDVTDNTEDSAERNDDATPPLRRRPAPSGLIPRDLGIPTLRRAPV